MDAPLTELIRFEAQFDANMDPTLTVADNYARLLDEEDCVAFVAEEDAGWWGICTAWCTNCRGCCTGPWPGWMPCMCRRPIGARAQARPCAGLLRPWPPSGEPSRWS